MSAEVRETSSDAPPAEELRWWGVAWASVVVGVLLRTWGLGGQDLTFDEAFTAAAARKPVGELLEFLRHNDTHPPLDYLLRKPFTGSASELLLRAPSAVFSIAALLLLARWMRPKGTFGAFTVIAASLMPFLVGHGRDARMYPLVTLLGVISAIAADRWLDRPTTRRALAVAGSGLLAMLAHSAAIPAAAALVLVPGLRRRDRPAWIFRGLISGSLVLWAVAWGPSFLDQSGVVTEVGYWLPYNSPGWFETVSAAFLSPRTALLHVSFVVFLLSVAFLLLRRDRIGRLAGLTFVLPFAVLAVAGFELRLFMPRSFAFGAWGVAAAVGAAVEWLRANSGIRGAAVGIGMTVALLLPSSTDLTRFSREELVEMDVLRSRLEPGDAISISPGWFRPLLEWNFVMKRGFAQVSDDVNAFVVVDPLAPPSGRLHVLDNKELVGNQPPTPRRLACEPTYAGSVWYLRCLRQP